MTNTLILHPGSCNSINGKKHFATNTLHKCLLESFETEEGREIVNLQIAYRVFGSMNEAKDNVVVVFHALTGDANCAGYESKEGYIRGWWDSLFQKGAPFDKEKFCIICPNHPSSCYGSSGPTDSAVGGLEPLGLDFPTFSPRGIARAHKHLLEKLGIEQVHTVIGGSLGGMVALEFALSFPNIAHHAIVIAAPLSTSAQALAFNHIQRKCFDIDPDFKNGRYYAAKRPRLALSLARQVGMITYRSPSEFDGRFGRNIRESNENKEYYEIQSYLDYQGEKLLSRFDPNSYIKLLDALDRHDIARERESAEMAMQGLKARMLFIGIDTDILYRPEEVKAAHELALSSGVDSEYLHMESVHGHDAFLIEFEKLHEMLFRFYA